MKFTDLTNRKKDRTSTSSIRASLGADDHDIPHRVQDGESLGEEVRTGGMRVQYRDNASSCRTRLTRAEFHDLEDQLGGPDYDETDRFLQHNVQPLPLDRK
jgi:hypothetical protein